MQTVIAAGGVGAPEYAAALAELLALLDLLECLQTLENLETHFDTLAKAYGI
jgi:hypothetical protein